MQAFATTTQFTTKKNTIEAIQWFRMGDHGGVYLEELDEPVGKRVPVVRTLDGVQAVKPGDWIITSHDGSLNACDPLLFALIWEPQERVHTTKNATLISKLAASTSHETLPTKKVAMEQAATAMERMLSNGILVRAKGVSGYTYPANIVADVENATLTLRATMEAAPKRKRSKRGSEESLRAEFEESMAYHSIDLTTVKNAWGELSYANPTVQDMWFGFKLASTPDDMLVLPQRARQPVQLNG